MIELITVEDTRFKLKPIDTAELSPDEYTPIDKNQRFKVHSHCPSINNHVKVALLDTVLSPLQRNTWFVYKPHVLIEGNEPGNHPEDPAVSEEQKSQGLILNLPDGRSVSASDFVLLSGHFTWGEVIQWDLRRTPPNTKVLGQIIKVARKMEDVRSRFGDRAISVNSWYRPPDINRAVGGASQSRHLVGDALDFNVQGLKPSYVRSQLEQWWGSTGGLASASVFVHLDMRGYAARWNYGY